MIRLKQKNTNLNIMATTLKALRNIVSKNGALWKSFFRCRLLGLIPDSLTALINGKSAVATLDAPPDHG
jgi:hypothetical protein